MNAPRVTSARVHILKVPVTEVHSHGSGDISTVHTIILELTTDSGLTGWGEASPWPVFTGTVAGNAGALREILLPLALNRSAFEVEPILAEADRAVVHCSEAKAALETALLDIQGQHLGLPISTLLGGRHRERVPLSFSIANPDFDEDFAKVARLVDQGIRIFKLKTGFAEHAFDLMRLEILRETYQDTLDLRIDYNQGMTASEALPRLRDFEAFRLSFIEQPVPRDNLEAMAHFTRTLTTPIMADESVFTPREALIGARLRVADIFSLKIMKSGGARRALEIAAIAKAAGIGVYGGCMFETGIAHAAGAQLMAALPELSLGCEFYMANFYLKKDILQDPFPVSGGYVNIPDGPGLGVSVDRNRLEKYRVAEHQISAAPATSSSRPSST